MNITWHDDNHATIINGRDTFDITVQRREMWKGGHAVKPRLYVGGEPVRNAEDRLGYRSSIAWAKRVFGPTLRQFLNREDLEMKFSNKAGCSCGCSPGFILDDTSIPFDIWMDVK